GRETMGKGRPGARSEGQGRGGRRGGGGGPGRLRRPRPAERRPRADAGWLVARPVPQRRVCVARIGAPHGVRGEVKFWSFTADPLAVKDLCPLETEDGKRAFTIETLRPAKEFFVVRLKGIAGRNAAEAPRKLELYTARARPRQ